jgi:hypothetical protein
MATVQAGTTLPLVDPAEALGDRSVWASLGQHDYRPPHAGLVDLVAGSIGFLGSSGLGDPS